MIINLEHTDVLNPAIYIEHSIAVILLFGSWDLDTAGLNKAPRD